VKADDRIQFITLAGGDLSYAPLQTSRAAFCELLACTSSLLSFPLSLDCGYRPVFSLLH
jgi:hypothetical protein